MSNEGKYNDPNNINNVVDVELPNNDDNNNNDDNDRMNDLIPPPEAPEQQQQPLLAYVDRSLFEFVNDYVQADRYINDKKEKEHKVQNAILQPSEFLNHQQQQQQQQPNDNNPQQVLQPVSTIYQASTVDEKSLSIFTDALGKVLGLEQPKVFNWERYFSITSEIVTEDEILLCFEFPSFIIQYSLLLIHIHQHQQSQRLDIKRANRYPFYFQKIINNETTRTKLLTLIENNWHLLAPNRGGTWINLAKININLQSQAQVLNSFLYYNLATIPMDKTRLEQHETPLYTFIQPPDPTNFKREIHDDWLCLVAQACLIQYDQAFTPRNITTIDIEHINECFEGQLANASVTVKQYIFSAFHLSKTKQDTFVSMIISNKFARVIMAKLISNYFAEAQIKSLTGQLNKDIAKLRASETSMLYNVLSTLFV